MKKEKKIIVTRNVCLQSYKQNELVEVFSYFIKNNKKQQNSYLNVVFLEKRKEKELFMGRLIKKKSYHLELFC